MNNLISNAIKFSEAGGEVEIEASLRDADVELRVLDRGVGVPEAFRSRLFQSFAQADNSNERNAEGTGLGLSISRELMARLGGDIGYAPREGGGSCFWVSLPTAEESPAVAGAPAHARVLIVEDDPDVAVVLGMLISRQGFEPVYASNLAGAREQLRITSVQAITLDLGLGDERGEDLLAELRANPATAELPVLIVSGKTSAGDPADARTARMSKPLNPSTLIAALKAITADRDDSAAAMILHVEDDHDHARFVQDTLRGAATVLNACSVSEAEAMLAARRFDLVILDLGLPDGDGHRLLNALPRPPPPVLVLSQRVLDPDAARPFAAVLTKSGTDAAKLERCVQMLLPSAARVSSKPEPRGAE
jgi:DNA-binding response OmpR family regulator